MISIIKSSYVDKYLFYSIMFLATLSFLLRALLVVYYPGDSGDQETYLNFATNLLGGCGWSSGEYVNGACPDPTYGGYFPLYPAFLAACKLVAQTGMNWIMVAKLTQSLIYAISLSYLLLVLWKSTRHLKLVIICGFILALSPLQVGWYRFILTEPLVLAAVNWFIAEIIFSLHRRKFHRLRILLPLVVCVYIKPDTVFLIFMVFTLAVLILDYRKCLFNVLVFSMLFFLSIAPWGARDYSMQGAAYFSGVNTNYQHIKNYQAWVATWAVTEYERSGALFALNKGSPPNPHPNKYLSAQEVDDVNAIFLKYDYKSGTFPKELDNEFILLKQKRGDNTNLLSMLGFNLNKGFNLILNPYASYGLPLELRNLSHADRILLSNPLNNWQASVDIIRVNLLTLSMKILLLIYRVLIAFCFLLFVGKLILKLFRHQQNKEGLSFAGQFAILILFSLLARFAFFTLIGGLEHRYMVPFVPLLECSVAIILMYGFERRKVSSNALPSHLAAGQ